MQTLLPLILGQLPPLPLFDKNFTYMQLCRGRLFLNFAGVWCLFSFETGWFRKLYSNGPNFTGTDFSSPHASYNSILNPTRLNSDNTTSLKQVDDARKRKKRTMQEGQTLNQQMLLQKYAWWRIVGRMEYQIFEVRFCKVWVGNRVLLVWPVHHNFSVFSWEAMDTLFFASYRSVCVKRLTQLTPEVAVNLSVALVEQHSFSSTHWRHATSVVTHPTTSWTTMSLRFPDFFER